MEFLKKLGAILGDIFLKILGGVSHFIGAHPKATGGIVLLTGFILMLAFGWFMNLASQVIGLGIIIWIIWPSNKSTTPTKKKKGK